MIKQVDEILDNLDRAEEVVFKQDEEDKEIIDIIDELKRELENSDRTSLTAPHLGYNKRIFVMKFADGVRTYVNPMIQEVSETSAIIENSILTGDRYLVFRGKKILAAFQDAVGKIDTNQFDDTAAGEFQQCVNLLDGVTDELIGLRLDEDWDLATEEERQEVVEYYINQLKQSKQELDTEIESDEELKKLSDGIKFMTSVATGETKLDVPDKKPMKLNHKARRYLTRIAERAKKKRERSERRRKEREAREQR